VADALGTSPEPPGPVLRARRKREQCEQVVEHGGGILGPAWESRMGPRESR
jgi:hypothetical protein